MKTAAIIQKYYDTFNATKWEDFLDLLSEDVVHDINQGNQEIGKAAFRTFMQKMQRHYKEKVVDLVILTNETGTRAAAEFFIEGTYLATDPALPPARGQKYRLRCGAFFEFEKDKISRVTNYYNLNEWLETVH